MNKIPSCTTPWILYRPLNCCDSDEMNQEKFCFVSQIESKGTDTYLTPYFEPHRNYIH